jgi:hypothetical protein
MDQAASDFLAWLRVLAHELRLWRVAWELYRPDVELMKPPKIDPADVGPGERPFARFYGRYDPSAQTGNAASRVVAAADEARKAWGRVDLAENIADATTLCIARDLFGRLVKLLSIGFPDSPGGSHSIVLEPPPFNELTVDLLARLLVDAPRVPTTDGVLAVAAGTQKKVLARLGKTERYWSFALKSQEQGLIKLTEHKTGGRSLWDLAILDPIAFPEPAADSD